MAKGIDMKEELPKHFTKFVDKYPDVWQAHQKLTEATAECGPLDRKTRELIKIAISAADPAADHDRRLSPRIGGAQVGRARA